MGSGARNGVKSKYLTFAGSLLDAEVSVSFQDALSQHRLLAFTPQLRVMRDAVVDRAAVGARTAIEWPGNTDELSRESVGGHPNGGVPVPADVREGKMRRHFGIRNRAGLLHVAALRIFQTRTDAVED